MKGSDFLIGDYNQFVGKQRMKVLTETDLAIYPEYTPGKPEVFLVWRISFTFRQICKYPG
jgi:hypothetical protein